MLESLASSRDFVECSYKQYQGTGGWLSSMFITSHTQSFSCEFLLKSPHYRQYVEGAFCTHICYTGPPLPRLVHFTPNLTQTGRISLAWSAQANDIIYCFLVFYCHTILSVPPNVAIQDDMPINLQVGDGVVQMS